MNGFTKSEGIFFSSSFSGRSVNDPALHVMKKEFYCISLS